MTVPRIVDIVLEACPPVILVMLMLCVWKLA